MKKASGMPKFTMYTGMKIHIIKCSKAYPRFIGV